MKWGKTGKQGILTLNGKELSLVARAVHLGHEFHESGVMDQDGDAMVKRAKLISNLVEVRECF